jgi:hypothetical protein
MKLLSFSAVFNACLDSPQAPKNIADKVIGNMKKKYKGNPTFYITEPCEGTRVLTLPK